MQMNVLVEEHYINATEQHMIDHVEPYESDISLPITRETFNRLVEEYGRCTSKVYVDPGPRHVGYVFVKRAEYEDTHETFLRETWITFHESAPTVTREAHFADLG